MTHEEAMERNEEIRDALLRNQKKIRHFTSVAKLCDESMSLIADPIRLARLEQIAMTCRQAYKCIQEDLEELTEELVSLSKIIEGPDVQAFTH